MSSTDSGPQCWQLEHTRDQLIAVAVLKRLTKARAEQPPILIANAEFRVFGDFANQPRRGATCLPQAGCAPTESLARGSHEVQALR
jgi:hypothetical protein